MTPRSRRPSAGSPGSCTPTSTRHDPEAEDKFKEAAEAYEVLSDPERRATYDRYGHEGLRSGGCAPNYEAFGSVSDIFEAFFGGGAFGDLFGLGGGAGGAVQGGDVAVSAEIDAGRRRAAARRSRSATRRSPCASTATATAPSPGTPIETCPRCQGRGQLRAVSARRSARSCARRCATCATATAACRASRARCAAAAGAGRAPEGDDRRPGRDRRRPADPDHGRGHAGERGGPAGDLYVLVRVREDSRFLRDGDDLVTAVDVPAPLAALGDDGRGPDRRRRDRGRDPAGTQPHETLDVARRRACPRCAAGRTRRPARGRQRGRPAPPEPPAARAARAAGRSMTEHNLRPTRACSASSGAPSAATEPGA